MSSVVRQPVTQLMHLLSGGNNLVAFQLWRRETVLECEKSINVLPKIA